MQELRKAIIHHFLCLLAMSATGVALVGVICALNMTMSWYSLPELVFPIYALPMINAGMWVHLKMREGYGRGINAEMVHYDSMMLIYSLLLLLVTMGGYASAVLYLIHVIFPILRDPLIYVWGKMGVVKGGA